MDESSFGQAVQDLVSRDADLARIVHQHGRPALWTRPPGYPALVLFILEQQVSLASAAAAYSRLAERLGGMSPELLARATPEELRASGVSRQKDRYLRALSAAVLDGTLDLAGLAELPDDEVRRALVALPGIGPWTADVYLLACLGRPDLWPIGDRAPAGRCGRSARTRRSARSGITDCASASAGGPCARPRPDCCGTATCLGGAARRLGPTFSLGDSRTLGWPDATDELSRMPLSWLSRWVTGVGVAV